MKRLVRDLGVALLGGVLAIPMYTVAVRAIPGLRKTLWRLFWATPTPTKSPPPQHFRLMFPPLPILIVFEIGPAMLSICFLVIELRKKGYKLRVRTRDR